MCRGYMSLTEELKERQERYAGFARQYAKP